MVFDARNQSNRLAKSNLIFDKQAPSSKDIIFDLCQRIHAERAIAAWVSLAAIPVGSSLGGIEPQAGYEHEGVDVHNLSRLLALKDKQRAQSKKRSREAWLVAFCDSLTSPSTFCCILSANTNELLCVKLLSSFVWK